MANFICYGTQRINPVADATINLIYDANVNSDATNEVRLLIDSTLTVPAIISVNLPQIANFDGIFNVQIFVVDSGDNASVKDIVVTPFAGDTINGGASLTLSTDGSTAVIQIADGNHWYALV